MTTALEKAQQRREESLRWLIGERDCFYEGCAIEDEGDVLIRDEDRQVLDTYDKDIDELRTLIAAATGHST